MYREILDSGLQTVIQSSKYIYHIEAEFTGTQEQTFSHIVCQRL